MVADDPNGGDLDGDDGGVTGEEIRTESEDELIVPGRVFHAHLVHLCAELVGWVYLGEHIGLHAS